MSERRDEFLSDEDLALKNLTALELETYWRLWLTQAQVTNDADRASYSHGVFERDPSVSDSQPLAIDHGRTFVTTDGDFARFQRLRGRHPLARTR